MGYMNIEDVLKDRKDIKKINADKAPHILKRHGISFEVKNHSIYKILNLLIINHNDEFIYLWPATGLWIVKKDNSRGYGIYNLIKFIKGD